MSQPLSAKLDRIATRHAAKPQVSAMSFAAGDEHAMTDQQSTYAHRIVHDPAILAGKPVIRGTRIPVEVILEYLAHNPDFGELFADYPRLTMDDVKASLEYAQRLVRVEATPTPRRGSSSMRGCPIDSPRICGRSAMM